MVIDGKAIAQKILDGLKIKVSKLKEEGVTPHLAVVLIGHNESSKAYVRQKELKLSQIGGTITIHRFKGQVTEAELLDLIDKLNYDPIIQGIIIQRPLPPHIDARKVTNATSPTRDVDGFCDNAPFDAPVALAVWRILREVYKQTTDQELTQDEWLKSKKIVILGKGQTAGQPIIKFFRKKNLPITVVDSKTPDREQLIKAADIIISAVGRKRIVTGEMIKDGVILIGVGMRRGEDGKMRGDYVEEEVFQKAAYYTPVPGGVGPVNVAMLLSNLIKAAENL